MGIETNKIMFAGNGKIEQDLIMYFQPEVYILLVDDPIIDANQQYSSPWST